MRARLALLAAPCSRRRLRADGAPRGLADGGGDTTPAVCVPATDCGTCERSQPVLACDVTNARDLGGVPDGRAIVPSWVNASQLASDLTAHGYALLEGAVPASLLAILDAACQSTVALPFAPSGMGRGAGRNADLAVRNDTVRWLDGADAEDPGARAYLALMDDLRLSLNASLYLGLLDYECHYAIYAAGARYGRHVDALAGRTNRVLSTVVYLNSAWADADAGELILYAGAGPEPLCRILPRPGLMVVFLSEAFPHEVLAATRSRHSIAGWYSGRAQSTRTDSRTPH